MIENHLTDFLVEIAIALFVSVLSWVEFRMRSILKRVETIEKETIHTSDLKEVREDIKQILNHITELKVKQARWQGRAENLEQNKLNQS